MDPRRRQLCFFGLSASLLGSGCSHVPMVQQTYDNLASIGKNGDPDRYPMTAEQIQQLPYATLGTRFHGGAKAVMVLATVDADVLQWVAANHIVLETQDGTLFRTEGLDRNLVATRWLLPNPLTRLGAGEQLDRAVYRSVDIGLGKHVDRNVHLHSRWEAQDEETIQIMDESMRVLRIEEHVRVPSWRWATVNRYWVGVEDRQVWRSEQRFTPELQPLELELLKAYS